mmetsp:Transcript_25596/g.55060  ORF Transcript_25596/g.55060 Transcript_25596/m.55060 type:complete len:535 (+) Transcript_25596:178-1782(+)
MMRQPIRQISHITGANTNQPKSRRKCTREPIRLFVGLSLIWIIVFVTKFYSDQPQQPLQSRKDVSPNHNNTESNRPQQQEQELSDNNLVPNLRLNALDINNVDIISGSNDTQLNNGNNDFPEHYMVFSTDCTAYQDWQALVFFYNAHKVQQPGHVIRIASACSEQQQEEIIKFHETTISKLSSKFSVHFTPDFSKVSGDNYKYYNKPFGIQHWLEHGMKYTENKDKLEDAIIMILDPDMILLRPLTYDFTDSNVLIHKSKKGAPKIRKVMHGQPWASLYAFGDGPFRSVDLKHVFANHTNSPALRATKEEQSNNYPGGPPYMATGRDMHAIVASWTELVTRVHDVYQHLLGEMFGWSLAAAHLGLPHTLAESFMISAVDIGSGEGWPLIDALKQDDICEYSTLKEKEDQLPYVIHYCQNYWLGKWFVGKYRLDSDFLSCEKPLLLEPPKDIGSQYDFYIKPGGKPYGTKERLSKTVVKREQFIICQMIARLNDAATWFKDQTCEKGTANYEKSFFFHHSLDPNNNEGGEKTAKW